MSRLTILEGLPRPDRRRVGPHRYRVLGQRVLVMGEGGRRVFLSRQEYRDFLSGAPSHARAGELAAAGLLREGFDPAAAAEAGLESDTLSWPGPALHVLRLQEGGKTMGIDTAQAAVDFAFSAPGPVVSLELDFEEASAVWPILVFAVRYAGRRSEWSGRPVRVAARLRRALDAARLEFLVERGVEPRAVVQVEGEPAPAPAGARRLLARVRETSRPEAWVDAWAKEGPRSIRLVPIPAVPDAQGRGLFLGFYARAVDRMLSHGNLREEGAVAFLGGPRWALPGLDVLGELACGPDGELYTSEAALDEGPSSMFRLGRAGSLRYADLAEHPAVRVALAAALAPLQPFCFQCVYHPYCALPASLNLSSQGTPWGRTPASPVCALHMGLLDVLFERLADGASAPALEAWLTA